MKPSRLDDAKTGDTFDLVLTVIDAVGAALPISTPTVKIRRSTAPIADVVPSTGMTPVGTNGARYRWTADVPGTYLIEYRYVHSVDMVKHSRTYEMQVHESL